MRIFKFIYTYTHTYMHKYIYIYITHAYIYIYYILWQNIIITVKSAGSCGIADRVSWAAVGEWKWWPFPTVFNSTFTILHTNSKIRCRYDGGGGFHMKIWEISTRLLQNSPLKGSRQLQVSTVSGDGPYMGDGVLVMPSGLLGSFRKVKAYSIAMASTLALVLGCFEMW